MSTSAFYTATVPQSLPKDGENQINEFHISDVERFFELPSCVEWIVSRNLKRVALQFPDQFLKYSRNIYEQLERDANCKCFILADTSYRSCCVDEIAAAHSNCDGVIHYGDACLSRPSETIPIKYVFGRFPMNLKVLKTKFEVCKFEKDELKLLLVDSVYAHSTDEIYKVLDENGEDGNFLKSKVAESPEAEIQEETQLSLGRLVDKRFFDAENVKVVFIGSSESPFLPLWLMSHPQCQTVVHFDPQTGELQESQPSTIKKLRKRLFLIESLKDASIVGLVVGTTAIKGHREAIQRMRELCKISGKQLYVFSVGKVNVAKLSNFSATIDVFVLLSCPFGILLDQTDFYRPVVSFFEAEIALNPEKNWHANKGWTADFSELLEGKIGSKIEDDENVDVSLVSGKIRANLNLDEKSEGSSTTVALYTAGDYFDKLSWKGLDDSVKNEASTEVTEGRTGIASAYRNEPK
ncbi:hypothetical protein WR25_15329 [Diploscapter pachys]|uniref:2-(3-amino-3-carboxypropyl)histidine synthase subunit 2 n=1 Tax=Diploscapter pachys TaxID=2018661 RepID=A0A2A2KL63_9BILA|nr:hypothetical protein WR25_15329 [Diploscapter pachys]